MENKLQKYFDTQMETPEFAEAWKETEASYQAANILLKISKSRMVCDILIDIENRNGGSLSRFGTDGSSLSDLSLVTRFDTRHRKGRTTGFALEEE